MAKKTIVKRNRHLTFKTYVPKMVTNNEKIVKNEVPYVKNEVENTSKKKSIKSIAKIEPEVVEPIVVIDEIVENNE